jgi:hypothetical protein
VTAEQVAEWGWRSLNAEKIQGWLYGKLMETGTQDSYVAARLAVIRHAAGEMVAINDLIKQVGLPREGLYEPIPGWALVSRGGQRYWFPCPTCRWPMRFQLDRVSMPLPGPPADGGVRQRSRIDASLGGMVVSARADEG